MIINTSKGAILLLIGGKGKAQICAFRLTLKAAELLLISSRTAPFKGAEALPVNILSVYSSVLSKCVGVVF